MTQLALDLRAVAPPSLANFIAGRNAECVGALAGIAAGRRAPQFVYLWGAPGSGRSHLLEALGAGGRYLRAGSDPDDLRFDPACTLYAIDGVDQLDADGQHALFHLFNQVRAHPDCALVSAGDAPPIGLRLREDLRTRLGWGLVYELHLLSDEDKAAALRRVASERGVVVSADVVPWLLTHRSRDIRALLEQFDAIDRFAFEHRRPITLPLVRDWLQSLQDAG